MNTNENSTAVSTNEASTQEVTAAELASKIEKNQLTVLALNGENLSEAEFAQVKGRLLSQNGTHILKTSSLETAVSIAGNEKIDADLKESTQAVVDAHASAFKKALTTFKPAIITILTNAIGDSGKNNENVEVDAAYKELGLLNRNIFEKKTLPGLRRDEKYRGSIITGVTYEAYKLIKEDPAMADLLEAAEVRRAAATQRLEELETKFKADYTEGQVKLFRTLETMQDYQKDPKSVSPAERQALIVRVGEGKDAKEMPIFEKGKLTKAAAEKLNTLQAVEGTPDFIVKMIRGVFAQNSKNIEVKALKSDIGL